MLGSTVGVGWQLPDTVTGWMVWIVAKLLVAGLNVIIFHCFIKQGKLNIKNEKAYTDALALLGTVETLKVADPRSPQRWHAMVYGKKGTSIFAGTALGTVALTQAILTFDWVSLLTYIFTITMGIIFGLLQMRSEEVYWTEEFPEWVNKQIEVKQNDNDRQQTISQSDGTSTQE